MFVCYSLVCNGRNFMFKRNANKITEVATSKTIVYQETALKFVQKTKVIT